jgi:hypothetical protein
VLIQFAAAYVTSAENRSNFVTGAYTTYLGRTPSAGEVSSWVAALQQGTTAEQVIAAFVGSAEYFQKQGTSNSSWVNHAYQDILGRQADSGSQGFLTQANSGVSLTVLATTLIGSTEYRSNLISQVYATYLFRQAGPSDLQTWLPVVGQLSAGPGKPSPDEQFLTAVIGSVEYFQKIGNTQLAWTSSLYTKLLGRAPDQAGLTSLLVNVLNGFSAPRQAATAGIAASTEAETAAVAGYYTQFLGRTGSAGEVSGWVNLILGGTSREQVIAAIVGSTEYFQKHGGANNTFADQLYLDLLGRARGSSETGFLTALTSGTLTPQQAAAAILQSTEYAQRLVSQFYSTALGRQGSLTEINGWVQVLQQGIHDEQILAQIIASAEFFLGPHPYP